MDYDSTTPYAWLSPDAQGQVLQARDIAGGAVWIAAEGRVRAMSIEERNQLRVWPLGWWWVRDIPAPPTEEG